MLTYFTAEQECRFAQALANAELRQTLIFAELIAGLSMYVPSLEEACFPFVEAVHGSFSGSLLLMPFAQRLYSLTRQLYLRMLWAVPSVFHRFRAGNFQQGRPARAPKDLCRVASDKNWLRLS